jgi:phosphoglucosamine mutase (EC 5.4.2.10)
VVEAMRRENAMLGGEQSGHLIFREFSTTGDGLLAALQLLRIMRDTGKLLSELAHLLEPFPQVLKNVRVVKKTPFEEVPAIAKAVEAVERGMAGKGRVLLRYSGTEPLARVMVEGENPDKVEQYAGELAELLEKNLR